MIFLLFFFPKFIFSQNYDVSNFSSDEDYLNLFYKYYPTPFYEKNYIKIIYSYFASKNNEYYMKIFNDPELYSRFFYTTFNNISIPGYLISYLNYDNYNTHIIINPCKNFHQYCCENYAKCEEENALNITAKKDLELAYVINNFLPHCDGVFDGDCGTFIEIHMPGNSLVLQSILIERSFSSGYRTVFISTKNLCSGKYEVWMVIKMKEISFLIYTKPFYVLFPSCKCSELYLFGYSC